MTFIDALNGLVFASFNFLVMENEDTEEEIFITQNFFSQESHFPHFGLDILDKMLRSELSEAHNQYVCKIDLEGKKKVELKYSKVNRDISLVLPIKRLALFVKDSRELSRRKGSKSSAFRMNCRHNHQILSSAFCRFCLQFSNYSILHKSHFF